MKRHLGLASCLSLAAFAGLAAAPSTAAVKAPPNAMSFQFWTDRVGNFIDTHGSALLCALIVMVCGLFISKKLVALLQRWLNTKPIEPPLRSLMCRIVHLLLLALALMVALQTAGVAITPLLTGIGVAGVGVSLASQGVLSNIISGLVIIFTKPFRVGEYVELIGVEGKVENIELMSTTLSHPDRSSIHIPNRKIVGEVVHNFGTIRQVNVVVGVSYDANLSEAFAAIRDVLKANPRVLKEIPPGVGITELADSSINIAVRPWATVNDFGVAHGEIYQALVERFRQSKIEMPFPQREVRIVNGPPPRVAV